MLSLIVVAMVAVAAGFVVWANDKRHAKYGIAVRVERSGAERVFTRIGQEYTANIRAVDVANTADAAHCIVWTRNGWLEPYLPFDRVTTG